MDKGLVAPREPRDAGWLTPSEIIEEVARTYGKSVALRTVQGRCSRETDALPNVLLGGKLLIHRADLLSWIKKRGGLPGAEPAA